MMRLVRLAPLALASFVAGVAVPQASFVAHDHAGGGAPHVHLEPLAVAHEHDHDGPHHPAHAAAPVAHGAAVHGTQHVHWQQPFQRVHVPAPPRVVHVERPGRTSPQTPPACLSPEALCARSRGPPAPVGA
jgi:hypothetical protein